MGNPSLRPFTFSNGRRAHGRRTHATGSLVPQQKGGQKSLAGKLLQYPVSTEFGDVFHSDALHKRTDGLAFMAGRYYDLAILLA